MSLKLIQVGLGGHGRGVARHFVLPSPDFIYAGLVDIDSRSLETFAEEHGLSKSLLYTNYRQAFREAGADAVLIEAASPVHYEICRAALENGLHVLVEKPFVTSMEEAEELVRLAAEKERTIMVNQNYRFFSTVVTLKQVLREQPLGKPLFANAEFYCDHDGKPYQREMDNYILLEMSVHHVDMIRFLLDTDITAVRGRTWNHPGSGYKGDPNVNALYETEAGVPVAYGSSLIAKGARMPWEGLWRIQCEEGVVWLNDLGEGYGVYTVDARHEKTKLPLIVPEHEGIHGTLAEFARSIRENREPAASGRDNKRTLAALLATSESSREGAVVRLSQDQ
ncbi:Gfo/Idh/MocA family protein [Paenibacillus arenilitoris]|uniref:Gfo/Idh/MocA family oxidoreductase n=1 Tax=Paenibacillus arenilitoris TaxID=2772299 RepID=A0A927CVY9_9BACL|nr:Gfo/Idh/MocA family oxidoreductase [Paenibacillus arenilitoris]MBD2872831.1 Gfo/Idh/MocA family oxidoreductase [Paenibacillus arenilitoris]